MNQYFHTAPTRSAAESIVRDGFDPSRGRPLVHELDDGSFRELVGVWIADERTLADQYPLATGSATVVVEVGGEIAEYEVTRRGESRRRWCIPFEVANASRRWVLSDEDGIRCPQ